MKNLLLIYAMMLLALNTMANDVLFFYPIKYEEQTDLFIKLAVPVEQAFLTIDNQKYYFKNDGVLLENISPEATLSVTIGQTIQGADYSLLDESISYIFNPSTNIIIDAGLYKELTAWSTSINQTVPLNNFLNTLRNERKIADEEILSFVQQFYNYKTPISKMAAVESNIQIFFDKAKGEKPEDECKCNFVLNHFASVSPLKNIGSNGLNGYNYLNSGYTLSEIIPNYNAFDSNSPKWHRWYTNEKGPAHDMFLRTYDSKGSFNYQWATIGMNNEGSLAPSPSYAYNTFQFLCVGQEFNLPKDCECTKKFCTVYEYNNILSVIARKLKPLSKVSSKAEELALVTIHNNAGVRLIDANRNIAFTECNGNFNFEFLTNLFDLAATVVGVVANVQDTTNGPPISNIPGAISDIGEALINLFQTPPILTTGNCENIQVKTALLRDFECFELRANDPTTITLQSFTFLGVAGSRKWDNYATAKSDFKLQSFVLSGSIENTEYCCSDKLGQHLYASMGGPVGETTHNNNATGAYYLFGPWDDFIQIGYAPVIPMNANRGYFSYNDKRTDCAPIKPKSMQDMSGLFSESFDEIIIFTNDEVAETEIDDSNIRSSLSTSISNITLDLYPNPTHDYLNIALKDLNLNAKIDLSIYNTLGQLVETIYEGQVSETSKNMTWSNNEIPNGTYHLVLRENNILIFGKAFVFSK